MFAYDYICLLVLIYMISMFTCVDQYLAMFTRVYSFLLVYICLLVFTYVITAVYLCLAMFTYVLSSLFTYV